MELYIKDVPPKGRGVFCHDPILKGHQIESSPVIIIPKDELENIEKTMLSQYFTNWPNGNGAIGLGFVSLYNHSDEPNAQFLILYSCKKIIVEAIKDIPAHEEIVVNYGNLDKYLFNKEEKCLTN